MSTCDYRILQHNESVFAPLTLKLSRIAFGHALRTPQHIVFNARQHLFVKV